MRVAHNKTNLVGQVFGRLTVLEEAGRTAAKSVLWKCRCACGNTCVVIASHLRSGHSTSCGCKHTERLVKHGMHRTTEYRIWQQMKRRCTDSRCRTYPRYGGRGITVCDRWLESFENFYADMGDRPSKQHSLDRIDNDGPYSPENCRWATWDVQYRNRRQTVSITYSGETKCQKDWCREYGVDEATFAQRLSRGWDVGTALKAPPYYQFFRDGPIA